MDSKSKTKYVVIIVICLVLAGGFWAWKSGLIPGLGSGSTDSEATVVPDATNAHPKVTGNSKTGFTVPSVFPQNTTFDLSVLDSSKYKLLEKHSMVVNTPGELGRENPFSKY